ncbi:MAG: hypothetical protein ABIR68_01595 [Ilumatobacteraceae bacterium]
MGNVALLIVVLRSPAALRALIRTHVLGVVGSGLVTVSLASSLFFRLTPEASQTQVVKYLGITLLPMAALTPLLGPILDRSRSGPVGFARRSNHLRALCCLGLAATFGSIGFYGWALLLLIGNKAYSVAKSALLPGLVADSDQLVAANARLSKWSAVGSAVATGLGLFSAATVGPRWTLCAAALTFLCAGLATRGVPSVVRIVGCERPAVRTTQPVERRDGSAAQPLRMAAMQYALIRCAVGLFAFGLAFSVRRAGGSAGDLALGAALYGAGSFGGNIAAPWVRRRTSERQMLELSLLVTAVSCSIAFVTGSSMLVLGGGCALGGAASLGRLAFDSVLQRTTSHSHRGRIYARFETRIQLSWVAGALASTASLVELRATVAVMAMLTTYGFVAGRLGPADRRIAGASARRRVGRSASRSCAVPVGEDVVQRCSAHHHVACHFDGGDDRRELLEPVGGQRELDLFDSRDDGGRRGTATTVEAVVQGGRPDIGDRGEARQVEHQLIVGRGEEQRIRQRLDGFDRIQAAVDLQHCEVTVAIDGDVQHRLIVEPALFRRMARACRSRAERPATA